MIFSCWSAPRTSQWTYPVSVTKKKVSLLPVLGDEKWRQSKGRWSWDRTKSKTNGSEFRSYTGISEIMLPMLLSVTCILMWMSFNILIDTGSLSQDTLKLDRKDSYDSALWVINEVWHRSTLSHKFMKLHKTSQAALRCFNTHK